MITCVIQYTIDPNEPGNFEKYAAAWPPVIERCGGRADRLLPAQGRR